MALISMNNVFCKSEFCSKITGKLYDYRISLKLSSNKVREVTDIDVNKIENCESNLTVYTLYNLLNYYGKTMSEFFTELENNIISDKECP